jgi:hypothetical protein
VKITTEDIRSVEPLVEIRCTEQEFDYVDVIGFSTKPEIAPHSKTLWYVTKSATREDLSWSGDAFDRSATVSKVSSEHRDWVVLTDSSQVAGAVTNRCILVPDVAKFLERLHRHVITVAEPAVVGVTGSVGKITCVALLEDIFSQHGKTLRVYAKRITPLNLEIIELSLPGKVGRSVVVVRVHADRAPRPVLMAGSAPVRVHGRNALADRNRLRQLFDESPMLS